MRGRAETPSKAVGSIRGKRLTSNSLRCRRRQGRRADSCRGDCAPGCPRPGPFLESARPLDCAAAVARLLPAGVVSFAASARRTVSAPLHGLGNGQCSSWQRQCRGHPPRPPAQTGPLAFQSRQPDAGPSPRGLARVFDLTPAFLPNLNRNRDLNPPMRTFIVLSVRH